MFALRKKEPEHFATSNMQSLHFVKSETAYSSLSANSKQACEVSQSRPDPKVQDVKDARSEIISRLVSALQYITGSQDKLAFSKLRGEDLFICNLQKKRRSYRTVSRQKQSKFEGYPHVEPHPQ